MTETDEPREGRDERLLSGLQIGVIYKNLMYPIGQGTTDRRHSINALISHIDALTEQIAAIARAAVAYDEAIMSCAEDPDKMSTYCTAEGEDLDALYFALMTKARSALGLPNVLNEPEPAPEESHSLRLRGTDYTWHDRYVQRADGEVSRPLEVLHQIHQDNGRGYCDTCTERYPCTTILEVDALASHEGLMSERRAQWSREGPTEPGMYWYRNSGTPSGDVLRLPAWALDAMKLAFSQDPTLEWCGPLTPPEADSVSPP